MKKDREQYTVQLDPEFVKKIDKMADKYDLSRSQLMRNLLELAFDQAVLLDQLGMMPLVKYAKDRFRNVMEGISDGKYRFNEIGELKVIE